MDLVPDDRRNTVYSLLPFITNLLGIGGALFGGFVIKNYGIADAILLTTLDRFVGVIIVGIGLKLLPD
ncbi:MAG: hypothetical protein ACW97Z_15080 [Candidatus Hodarchaeales archaeon]